VELILGRGLQVAVEFVALDFRIHDLPWLDLVKEVGVGDLLVLAHAVALLDHVHSSMRQMRIKTQNMTVLTVEFTRIPLGPRPRRGCR
jgi:hypothetical protein